MTFTLLFFFSLSKWLEVALLKLCSHLEEYDEGNGMYWQQAAPLWVLVIWDWITVKQGQALASL